MQGNWATHTSLTQVKKKTSHTHSTSMPKCTLPQCLVSLLQIFHVVMNYWVRSLLRVCCLLPGYSFKPRSTTCALTTATHDKLRPAVYRLPDAGTGKFSLTIQSKIDWSKRLGIDHFKVLPVSCWASFSEGFARGLCHYKLKFQSLLLRSTSYISDLVSMDYYTHLRNYPSTPPISQHF